MKKLGLVICLLWCSAAAYAGINDSLKVNIRKNTVTIGSKVIQSQTPISKVIEALGKPSRILSVAKTERVFIYDSLGLTFEIGKNAEKKVERITVSFNPKGNNRIAQTAYKGVVMMDGLRVTPGTTSVQVAQKTPIKDFNCFSTICSSVVSKVMLNLNMDFIDEKQDKLMDLIFILKH